MTLDATALKALCDIFGRYAVAEVEPGQRGLVVRVLGANNVSELSDDPKYSQPYGFVREAKVLLEEIETWPPGEQVPACLRQMENARRGRRPPSLLLVLERLIDRWFIDGNRWNAEQQHAYREVAPMILQWKDYFLSYTNRGTPPINNDYRELIEYHYGEKFKDRMATENGVARVVARYIRRHGLLGFFDEENIKCGEIIQDRVKEFCLKTFALVQLVEHQMFVDPGEDKINWCHQEYLYFYQVRDQLRKRLGSNPENFFIITPPVEHMRELFPERPLPEYDEWLADVAAGKVVRLRKEQMSTAVLQEEFRPLVRQIETLRQEYMDRLLSA